MATKCCLRGSEFVAHVGLYYYKARFYWPPLGRFLQTDPVGTADDLNLYAYVKNNPVNFTDPTGMIAASGFASTNSAPAAPVSAPVQAPVSAPKLDAPTFSMPTVAVGDAIQVAGYNGDRMGNNQRENKQARDVAVRLRLDKDQSRQLHDAIRGEGMDYNQVLEQAKRMFNK